MSAASLTIHVAVHPCLSEGKSLLILTTYGIRAGRYGSLGRVSREVDGVPDVSDLQAVADMTLTALYGLDYDL